MIVTVVSKQLPFLYNASLNVIWIPEKETKVSKNAAIPLAALIVVGAVGSRTSSMALHYRGLDQPI